jgi:hypothetical protein
VIEVDGILIPGETDPLEALAVFVLGKLCQILESLTSVALVAVRLLNEKILKIESAVSFEGGEVEEVKKIADLFSVFQDKRAEGRLFHKKLLFESGLRGADLVIHLLVPGNLMDEAKNPRDILRGGFTERTAGLDCFHWKALLSGFIITQKASAFISFLPRLGPTSHKAYSVQSA